MNPATELCQLALQYKVDKCPQIKHSYTPFYYNLFKDKRDTVKKVLEIGILQGGSLLMWRDFFPQAKIYGADIRRSFLIRRNRIESFYCDQSQTTDLTRLIEQTGANIDIFIDDGSHIQADQVLTCLTVMPLVKKDVIYIIEDVSSVQGFNNILAQYGASDIYYYEVIPFGKKTREHDDTIIVVKNKHG